MRIRRRYHRYRKLKARRVGVLMGGLSEEREISFKTGRAVLAALRESGFRAQGVDAGRDLPAVLLEKKIEVAFVALHGRYGEDGCVQGMLEVMGLPYTGSGVRASSVAMDKAASKRIFAFHGIDTPEFEVAGPDKLPRVKLPAVVKPSAQGSAIGVAIVENKKDLKRAVKKALKLSDEVLVERFVPGRELTVGVLDGAALPVIEIRPKEGFYDYKAKYTKDMTEFMVPAPIGKRDQKRTVDAALAAYRVLGCAGAARVDMILPDGRVPQVLEVNTIPGMTETSLLPMAARAAGLGYRGLVSEILAGAGLDK